MANPIADDRRGHRKTRVGFGLRSSQFRISVGMDFRDRTRLLCDVRSEPCDVRSRNAPFVVRPGAPALVASLLSCSVRVAMPFVTSYLLNQESRVGSLACCS